MEIDIVIISWAKTPELEAVTQKGLDTLFASAQEAKFHVVVVESNPDVVWDQAPAPHTCQTVHPKEEFGYHRYLNIGRKLGKSPYVALCNSDLEYTKGWAETLVAALESLPSTARVLSASPWCPETQGGNTPHLEKFYHGHRVRVELAGWCIFQKREIYNELGELDERFRFWWCDNDYAKELETRGLGHILVPASVVHHHENVLGKTGETLNDNEKFNITMAQQEVFYAKWGITK